jgi:HD-like signal output (HDOD) protein
VQAKLTESVLIGEGCTPIIVLQHVFWGPVLCRWNLDSHLSAPTAFSSDADANGEQGVRQYLLQQVAEGGHLLLIKQQQEEQQEQQVEQGQDQDNHQLQQQFGEQNKQQEGTSPQLTQQGGEEQQQEQAEQDGWQQGQEGKEGT